MMPTTLIINPDGLIGDFLGTIPAMLEIAEKEYDVSVIIHSEAEKIFNILPRNSGLKRIYQPGPFEYSKTYTLDTSKAFEIANQKSLYMSQAYMAQAGLDIPSNPPRALFQIDPVKVPEYNIILVPFARSLPPQEKWSQIKWQTLVNSLPSVTFCVFGNSVHDPKGYITGPNVKDEYDNDFNTVCNIMYKAKTVISVVTGISHLCFHLAVPNILLTNQSMTWGNNPDAFQIKTPIPDLKVSEVLSKINLVVQ